MELMNAFRSSRWVLVTGGSRGIGRGVVEHLCGAGLPVVFTYKSSVAAARELELRMREVDRPCFGVHCDGSDGADVERAMSDLIGRLGAPYALVNNMGITRDALLVSMRPDEWSSVLETNLSSAFYFARRVCSEMITRRSGVILQMSSVSGLKGVPGQTNYAATKAGMIGFTRSLALELGRFGIRVNAIAPGYIQTEMLDELAPAPLKAINKQIPIRRLGTIADVANLVEFLISDKASYITGQTIVVDGGLST